MEIRTLQEGDLDELLALRRLAYPGASLPEERMRRFLLSRLPHTRGLFVDGSLACVTTFYPFEMWLDGQAVPMGGLAGVASAPEHRRQGLVRRLLEHELERLRSRGVGWSLEYPFDPRFYQRLGWRSVPNGMLLELPLERLFRGRPPAARRLELDDFPSLAPLYERWSRRYSFALTRRDDPRDPWRRVVRPPGDEEAMSLYELEDAYVVFAFTRHEGAQVLEVEDYAYVSPEGRRNLLSFLGSFLGQCELVRIHLPDDEPEVHDYRQWFARRLHHTLQARVVDLAAALAPLPSARRWSLTLRLHDPLCPWNDGLHRLEAGPEGVGVQAGRDPADVELAVDALPPLLVGAIPAEAALAQGLARGSVEALECLASLCSSRPTFMPVSDGF